MAAKERYVFEIRGKRCVLTPSGWICQGNQKLERYLNKNYAPADRPITVISQTAMTAYDVMYDMKAKLIEPDKLPTDVIEGSIEDFIEDSDA